MKVALIALGIVAILVLLIVVPGCSAFNRFVALEETADGAWANVETVLQRRFDLIPNLVNTVKGYAKQEREVLTEVTRLRSQWGEAKSVDEKAQVASRFESALGRLMVVVERYPDLKSNQNFLALQDELAGTENRISVERRRFNDAVKAYNTAIRRIPGRFYASLGGFERKSMFEAAPEAQAAPTVEF